MIPEKMVNFGLSFKGKGGGILMLILTFILMEDTITIIDLFRVEPTKTGLFCDSYSYSRVSIYIDPI